MFVLFGVCRVLGVVRRSVFIARFMLHVYVCLPFVVCCLPCVRFLWVCFYWFIVLLVVCCVVCVVCYVLFALVVCCVLFLVRCL